MENNNDLNQKEVKIWLAVIGIFMGIFTALIAVILDIQKIDLLRGVSIAGMLVLVGITVLLSYRVKNSSLKTQFLTLIGIYIVSAGFFLWIGTWFVSSSKSKTSGTEISGFVEYYDFESANDLEGWEAGSLISNEQSFSGERALIASLPVSADQETTFYLNWQHEFFADLIVGQVYWPGQSNINLEWAQVCIPFDEWLCAFISKKPGWNTFVLDLAQFEALESQDTQGGVQLPGIVIQGVLKSTNPNLKSAPVFVDAIQIFVDGQK